MQQWEYMWIYVTKEKRKLVYVANGKRLEAQSYPEALNLVGKEGWELVAVISPTPILPSPTQEFPTFCLKRPILESPGP